MTRTAIAASTLPMTEKAFSRTALWTRVVAAQANAPEHHRLFQTMTDPAQVSVFVSSDAARAVFRWEDAIRALQDQARPTERVTGPNAMHPAW